jgi:hypothetical protein
MDTKPITEEILVRMYRSKFDRSLNDDMAVIIWPYEAFTYEVGPCTLWQRMGQHGTCDLWAMQRLTRPATPDEAMRAIAQWRSEGPDRTPADIQFVIRQRVSYDKMRRTHEEQVARYREALKADPLGGPWIPPRNHPTGPRLRRMVACNSAGLRREHHAPPRLHRRRFQPHQVRDG